MALPISPTPTLSGKDAKLFMERFNNPSLRPKPAPVDVTKVYENIQKVKSEQKQF